MAKRNSDPRLAYTGVKFQVRDLVRIVGIVDPFAPREGRYPGKIRFIEPQGVKGDLYQVSPAAVCHGKARQNSGTGPCGDCRMFPWVPGPRGQNSGIIRFIEKPGVQNKGVAMWLSVMSDYRYGT